MEQNLSFFSRLSLAFKLIFSREYAEQLLLPKQPEPEEENPVVELTEANTDSALQLLALLQKDGRLIDFIHEDINAFGDDQVAAAARVIHQGVKKTLSEHVQFTPATEEVEGNPVSLPEDFDKSQYRLTGNVSGSAPYNGTLIHKGWKVQDLTLPQVSEGTNLNVIAPAEVEL